MSAYRILIVVALALAVARPAFACGPYFPNAYFAFGTEIQVIQMPEASFLHELYSILNVAPPQDVPRRENVERWEHSLNVDSASLEETLLANGQSQEKANALTLRYRALRATSNRATDPHDALIITMERDLSGVPLEFVLYAQGAAAYHAGDLSIADAKWSAILALPEDQRRHRSVWAAYMLGRSKRDHDLESATRFFEQAIDLAENGFPDPLNLAGESYGWLGYLAKTNGDLVTALHRYAEQFAMDGERNAMHSAHLSLNETCKDAVGSESVLAVMAQDELGRAIMTAWVVSHPATQQAATEWLTVLEKSGIQVDDADLLAWTAYDHGNFDAARKWLEQSSANTAVAEWVRAKLAMRDGDIAVAESSFRAAITLAHAAPHFLLEADAGDYGYPATVSLADLAQRELGVVLLGQGRYTDALDQYMRAGHWMDAAYIAERVLTIDELRAYVDARAGNPEFVGASDEFYFEDDVFDAAGENASTSPDRMDMLKYVLARRLARAGEWEDAMPYIPRGLLPLAKELAAALGNGAAGAPPQTSQKFFDWFIGKQPQPIVDRDRAAALFHAAELAREHGLRLLGTEVSPDWTIFDGNFALRGADDGRLAVPRNFDPHEALPDSTKSILQASNDELRRSREHAPQPYKRYHYRYVAADLMWQCAGLLPNDDIDTMRALWAGGMYIQSRDPQAANKFYRSLVWRNPNMPYAQQADKRRWFPPNPPQ